MSGLVADLRMAEAERPQARGRALVIAAQVFALLGGRAVVGQAVGLHNQVQLGPEEVHAAGCRAVLAGGPPKAGPSRDGQEEPLQFGVGEDVGVAVEGALHDRNAGAAGYLLYGVAERLGVGQAELVGFADGAVEVFGSEAGCQVDNGNEGDRGGDASMDSGFAGL